MNKYRAKAVEIDGYRFASKKEARRYQALRLLVVIGEIDRLQVHPVYPLLAYTGYEKGPVSVGRYTADFEYRRVADGVRVTEDVKGGKVTRTEAYRLRKRIVKANYSIDVQEV